MRRNAMAGARVGESAQLDATDRLMQYCGDDGVIAHGAGLTLAANPFSQERHLGWAWETGWKEAAFVSQSAQTGPR